VASDLALSHAEVEDCISRLVHEQCTRLWNMHVFAMEVKYTLRQGSVADLSAYRVEHCRTRIDLSNGLFPIFEAYSEVTENGRSVYHAFPGQFQTALHGTDLTEPYVDRSVVERRRELARKADTSYVYDYPTVFRRGVELLWTQPNGSNVFVVPSQLLEATELELNESGALVAVQRPAGENKCGMVAWRFSFVLPDQNASGCKREAIVIANDITFQNGTFGVTEDDLFNAASCLARQEGLPRIYLAANSGARIGLAEEVKSAFGIRWKDETQPWRGFDTIYLDDDKAEELAASVKCVRNQNGLNVIDTVLGKQPGLGVENLQGSGLIAGETSKAYNECFTISMVTGRTVGIGAYLVRLGQRVVQTLRPAIILTGFAALNKVLGKEVYSSNEQIGGPRVMCANGISHVHVSDDLLGVVSILKWLSYVPVRRGAPLPIWPNTDRPDREVEFSPTSAVYDPRHLLCGTTDEATGRWLSGFFDRGSFFETLPAWAKTVVCGRARLGGVPVGVIISECRTVEKVSPADPANPDSTEGITQQAGCVWYPDSSFKTAQTIKDVSREELPLFIFANWRGFSGGMRDMFDEVLKYGSYIVDALVECTRPVFVYIPPGGELRGGII
jgi:acetyl-CoA carboxylase carboxyltransferase component